MCIKMTAVGPLYSAKWMKFLNAHSTRLFVVDFFFHFIWTHRPHHLLVFPYLYSSKSIRAIQFELWDDVRCETSAWQRNAKYQIFRFDVEHRYRTQYGYGCAASSALRIGIFLFNYRNGKSLILCAARVQRRSSPLSVRGKNFLNIQKCFQSKRAHDLLHKVPPDIIQ